MDAHLTKLDKSLESYFVGKAPTLSDSAKETLVKIAPWFALIFGILGGLGVLSAMGLGLVATPFMALGGDRTLLFWFGLLLAAAQIVLELMAVKPLFARAYRGWELMFYSSLLSVVTSLAELSIFGLIMTAVSFYFLYQVKEKYS
jgi:hypothetical protein